MNTFRNLVADKVYLIGLLLLGITFTCFVIPDLFFDKTNDAFGRFFIHYVITVIYMGLLIATRRNRARGQSRPHIFLFLLISLTSAYALNRSLPVFELSVPWVCVAIVTYGFTYIITCFWHSLPDTVKYIVSFLLGSALLFFIYLSFYCFPVMPIGLFVFFALGFSLHIFVPVFFVVFTIRQAIDIFKEKKTYGWTMIAGVGVSLLIAVIFVIQWNSINNNVSKSFRKTLIADNTDLPAWVKVAQRMPNNWVTERYLKSKFVYSYSDGPFWDFDFSLPDRSFDEVRKHDPLVIFASLFSKPIEMDDDDRIKVLEAVYDSRHNAQERLWNGKNLHTNSITSNVRIWPALRMAYTEKTLVVANGSEQQYSWDREEAIYTFHLPEGAVVTSLSLWIDGTEQKARLTSVKKADSAYHQIVGVEQHDPSWVHWQEGNTVVVRVFPVTEKEKRIFKIGFTAPLRKEGEHLLYETAFFDGPDATGANETMQIALTDEPKGLKMPEGFTVNGDNRYIKENSKYDPFFTLNMDCPQLDTKTTFSFDGNSYTVAPYVKQRSPMQLDNIYMDVNATWSRTELEEVLQLFKANKVYVYMDNMIELTEGNKKDLFDELLKRRFSMFPLFEIKNPATSLVVSKSAENTPNISQLKGSDFINKLAAELAKGNTYKVFSVGSQLSPYLKSLREHRAFDYEQGNIADLKKLVADKQFAHSIEDSNHLAINDAEMMLVKSKDTAKGTGPDHLMRLFVYNHILQQLKNNISGDYKTETILGEEAKQAYVVSPVSSLIVLETQKDYDRFKITKGTNTLDDATLKSTGAVPEPHEWALIILAVLMGTCLLLKEKLKGLYNNGWSR